MAGVALVVTACAAASPAGSRAVMVGESEPGPRLTVRGVVYEPDGSTPAAGVEVHAYNTDIHGIYSENGGNRNPRIKGTVVTDERGRFEFFTVRPGSYPEGGVPAHVHFVLTDRAGRVTSAEVHFMDDPLVSEASKAAAREAGRFGDVRPVVERADGTLVCELDLKLAR